MERRVVGLFHLPWPADPSRLRTSRSPLQMYRYAVWFKANPRSAEYMQQLFSERFPDGEFFHVDENGGWRAASAQAHTVVLLYPDSIGLGFGGLEREVGRLRKKWAALRVLNGRRREFLWTASAARALRLRRLIERTMLGELVFLPVFVCLTPLLLLADLLRGRR